MLMASDKRWPLTPLHCNGLVEGISQNARPDAGSRSGGTSDGPIEETDMMTKEEMMKRTKEAQRSGFNRWMNEPMTRAMISMMPPSEHLEMLLKAAFECGFGSGSIDTVINIMENMMEKRGGK
jgi:hypothetical protein